MFKKLSIVLIFLFLFSSIAVSQKSKNLSIISSFTTENGLPDNDVRAIFQDKKDYLWFGTRNGGVSRFKGTTWKNYSEKSGLLSNGIISISQTSKNIWFGGGGGAQTFHGRKPWAKYKIQEQMGLAGRVVFSISSDSKDNVWFGTNAGASVFDGKKWKTYTIKEGLAHNVIHDIYADKSGNVWFATRKGGLNKLTNGKWEVYLKDKNCRKLFADKKGNLWVGTSQNGTIKFDGKTWKTFQAGQTLLPQTEDSKGNIWFATEGSGLVKFDGKTWEKYTTKEGLISDTVFSILEDNQSNLWVGTDKGVMKIKQN